MNLVRKLALLSSVLFICLIGIELVAEKIIATPAFNDKINISDEAIEFYKAHTVDLHHLRALDNDRWKLNENPSNAIFSIIAPFKNDQNNILIQGDSWAEQLDGAASRKLLTRFSEEKQVGIINAGTTSYAPSVMTVQLRKLRQQFNINPTHIVAVVDQSDIGDELCRYAARRNFDASNRLTGVRHEPFESNETYNLEPFFQKQSILQSDKFALQKLLESAALKIRHNLYKEERRCEWPEISRPLVRGISKEEEKDFISAIHRYIDTVFSDNRVKTLHIIVHPHRRHLLQGAQNRYDFYSGEVVESAIQSNKHSNKIILLDFLNQEIGSYLKRPPQEIFNAGDPASHLRDDIVGTELTPRILRELAKQL